MVGPRRPQFVLFGSSIVEYSFGQEGWGAALADIYARKADIFMRGYGGWNSRKAVQVLDEVFPKEDAVQPSLVIVYFGGNDSVRPRPDGPHVPLPEYVENMRKISIHLKVKFTTMFDNVTVALINHTISTEKIYLIGILRSLSEKTRVIFLTAPPVNEAQLLQVLGQDGRKNELCQKYADACVESCQEMGIKAINLCNAFKQHDNWLTTCFTDGVHLTPTGSKIVAKEILKVLKEADWQPSLYWEDLPAEFA
ncbi:putative SGNH hydrolase-type esterase domain, SGNH hydrolase superfamily [Helianthus annuus]|nr:putative SGNH hydrolase-type esterase domain, SGNH hydrolase superfamily [Helianthus annuus]KAJ0820743.1 putative SGNH hydrolase-type esterase domain, SGNH hydrolase superfamily [Helianthus annuus]